MIAAKTNLAEVLPKPYVELAIQIARGAAEFLKKDLVEGLDRSEGRERCAAPSCNRIAGPRRR